jgi:hypothetical protein
MTSNAGIIPDFPQCHPSLRSGSTCFLHMSSYLMLIITRGGIRMASPQEKPTKFRRSEESVSVGNDKNR